MLLESTKGLMLGPGGLSCHTWGETQLEKRHCRVNRDSLVLSPSIIFLKEGQVHQGGARREEGTRPTDCPTPCCTHCSF